MEGRDVYVNGNNSSNGEYSTRYSNIICILLEGRFSARPLPTFQRRAEFSPEIRIIPVGELLPVLKCTFR